MVSTRTSNKLKRAKKNQKPGEFIAVDESDSGNDSIDWDALMEEDSTSSKSKQKVTAAPKAKRAPTAVEKGKTPVHHLSMKRKGIAKRSKRIRGADIPEQVHVEEEFVPASTDRVKAFESRECIGERHVDVMTLRNLCRSFGRLIDEYGLTPICSFPEKTGFNVQLVRSFYLNASNLLDVEDGPLEFRTTVDGICLTITPHLIGEVIGMSVDLKGTNFMEATFPLANVWKEFLDGLCVQGTTTTGYTAFSRQLKLEYKLLNLIICFNVLPTLQSKVLRWDRMFFLFLFGHPEAAEGVNFNIPCVIWRRMAKFVKDTHPNERLPFPLIIMRILRKFGINTPSTSVAFSSGAINASTITKSRSSSQNEFTPLKSPTQGPSTQASPSIGDISLATIHSEQQRMSQELRAMTKKMDIIYKLVKRLSAANGDALSSGSGSE